MVSRSLAKYLLIFALPVLPQTGLANSAALYYLGNKPVTAQELSPAVKQQIFEVELENYMRLEQTIDAALLDEHLTALSEKQKKPRAQLENELFKVEVKEKDAQAWYNENKAMLHGRDYASIKGEIIPYLTRLQQEKLKKDYLATVKKEKQFRLALAKPEAPVVAITTKGFPRKGSENAKVTIVEFADYRCPHCKVASQVLKKVVDKYKDKVSLVFLDFPLREGTLSNTLAEAAVCAEEQGKFWEFHYQAFNEQESLNDSSPLTFAKNLKLDTEKFNACMQKPATKERVVQAKKEGVRIGVSGTPAIYLNGRKHTGYSEQDLHDEIERLLKS